MAEDPKPDSVGWAKSQSLPGVEYSECQLECQPVFGPAQAKARQLLQAVKSVFDSVRMYTQAYRGFLDRSAHVHINTEGFEQCRAAPVVVLDDGTQRLLAELDYLGA